MFTFAISCLTTSNLPWFMDLTFQIPMQHCSLQHWTYFHYQSYLQMGVVFTRLRLFILSGVSSPLISSSTYWPGEFIFQCPICSPFHTVHGVLKARILKWFAIPFSSGPHSVSPLHHRLSYTRLKEKSTVVKCGHSGVAVHLTAGLKAS